MVEVKIIQEISIKCDDAAPIRILADLVVEEPWHFQTISLDSFRGHCVRKPIPNFKLTMFGKMITSGQLWHQVLEVHGHQLQHCEAPQ